MITPDHDPVQADLAEDLPRRFPRLDSFSLDDAALEEELARRGLANAFPPLSPPPDPRDLHALVWIWILGLLAIAVPALILLGYGLRWWGG